MEVRKWLLKREPPPRIRPSRHLEIQLVYNDTQHPELVTPVRDGDAVLMPSGYEHGHFLVVEGGWLAR